MDIRNRRIINRWQTDWQAKIKLEGQECFCDCLLSDLNFKGLKMKLRLKLSEDAFIRFKLMLTSELIIDAEAWIVWYKTTDGVYTYGIYFSKIKDADKERIYKFMRVNFSKQMDQQHYKSKEKGGEDMKNLGELDKRVFERFAASLPMRLIDLNNNREIQARTVDISAKGVGFMVSQELQERAPLEIWLDIPDKGQPLYTRGNVAWSKVTGANEYRVGVNLEKADLMGLSRVLRME
ncbi:MAG: PilZ domain-containing protein [Candidatus Omnitrophota bacterium]